MLVSGSVATNNDITMTSFEIWDLTVSAYKGKVTINHATWEIDLHSLYFCCLPSIY